MNAPLQPAALAASLAAEFAGRAEQHDREASFPFENFDALREAGLLTLAAPQALGGQGASLQTLAEVIEGVGYGDAATGLVLIMQYIQHRSMGYPDSRWPAELARSLVAEAAQEVSLINALRVEPELGSPARGGVPSTVARLTPQGWRLSGHKVYSTGAPILKWYAVWARTDEASPRVGTFLVRAGSEGIRIEPTWDHLGLRASGSHDVIFDDVLLPTDHAIGLAEPRAAASEPRQVADIAVLLGALYTGVARAARDWVVGFLQHRRPASLGAPLSSLPRAQEAIGRIEALLLSSHRLLRSLAQDVDAGQPVAASDSGLVKVLTTTQAVKVVEEALALSSNHGLARRNPLERHLRDVLCGRIHTPQDDSAYVQAGRRALAV